MLVHVTFDVLLLDSRTNVQVVGKPEKTPNLEIPDEVGGLDELSYQAWI